MIRKVPLVTDEYYHVFNKSIEGFRIFNNDPNYQRMLSLIRYYQIKDNVRKFSDFTLLEEVKLQGIKKILDHAVKVGHKRVEIVAYCIMPTHIHFILRQLEDDGISDYMRFMQNSYASYFNRKYKRKGPLWCGRFKAVLIESNEQMLHLTRYIHLNPTSAGLIKNPRTWKYSSYIEYIEPKKKNIIMNEVIDLANMDYLEFVEEYKDEQRELAIIKDLLFDEE